jgi:hypothetical protein
MKDEAIPDVLAVPVRYERAETCAVAAMTSRVEDRKQNAGYLLPASCGAESSRAASLPCSLDLFTETGMVPVLGTVFGCVWFLHDALYAFMTT